VPGQLAAGTGPGVAAGASHSECSAAASALAASAAAASSGFARERVEGTAADGRLRRAMPQASDSRVPFADLRVLDFSQVLAGPYTGRLLAEMGADVIKVEAPAGDLSRRIAPRRDRGQSGLYTWANLGKRNVCIDLARPAGRALALDLVRASHVVLENFRPGVADRLGIGWEAVHAANPCAVLVSVNGFGSDSSLREHGAFAPTMHAAAGLVEYQARKAAASLPEAPTRMLNLPDARADLTTALHAAIGLLAALRVAERSGVGQHLEVAMYDAVLATYPETPFELLDPPELREEPPPYDAGPNGHLVVAGPPQHVWAVISKAVGLEDPAPAGADVPTKARLRHAALERWMAAQPGRDELVRRLEQARIPCAPVRSLREALTGDFARERALLLQVDDRRGGVRPVVRLPYRFSAARVGPRHPAPRRGEHNAEVLREVLGFDDRRIDALRSAGALLAE
jgi:CoA:oxalate CoA-transferase